MTSEIDPGDPRDRDDALAGSAAELLRRSADDLDAATASRLNRARQAALAGMARPARLRSWLLPTLPVAVVAAAVVAALVVGLWPGLPVPPPVMVTPTVATESAADAELLLAPDNLEMLEDLDFYAWLDADLSDTELRAELESAG
ncbi:MAG: hypothetical protein ABI567_12580 [Gammaproteobacteria bacterium]